MKILLTHFRTLRTLSGTSLYLDTGRYFWLKALIIENTDGPDGVFNTMRVHERILYLVLFLYPENSIYTHTGLPEAVRSVREVFNFNREGYEALGA